MVKIKIRGRKKKKTKTNIEDTCNKIKDEIKEKSEEKEEPKKISKLTEEDKIKATAIIEDGKTTEKEFIEKKKQFLQSIREKEGDIKRKQLKNNGMNDKSKYFNYN
jgi:hypothetical protein